MVYPLEHFSDDFSEEEISSGDSSGSDEEITGTESESEDPNFTLDINNRQNLDILVSNVHHV